MKTWTYTVLVLGLWLTLFGCPKPNGSLPEEQSLPEWIDSLGWRNLTLERCPCFAQDTGIDTLLLDYDDGDGHLDSMLLFYSGFEDKFQVLESKDMRSFPERDSDINVYDNHGERVLVNFDPTTKSCTPFDCMPELFDSKGHYIGYLLLGCSMEQAGQSCPDYLHLSLFPEVECAGLPALLVRYSEKKDIRNENRPLPPNSTQYEQLNADSVLVTETDPWGRMTRRFVALGQAGTPKDSLQPLAEIWAEEVEVRKNHWEYKVYRRDSAGAPIRCRVQHQVKYYPKTNIVEIRKGWRRFEYPKLLDSPLEEWEVYGDHSMAACPSDEFSDCYILDYERFHVQRTDVIICPDCKKHQTVLYRAEYEFYANGVPKSTKWFDVEYNREDFSTLDEAIAIPSDSLHLIHFSQHDTLNYIEDTKLLPMGKWANLYYPFLMERLYGEKYNRLMEEGYWPRNANW